MHGGKMPRRVQKIVRTEAAPASEIIAQVVQRSSARRLPPKANKIKFRSLDAGEIQASLNRADGKSRVVLFAAQPLFGNSKQRLAVAHDARGRIVHLRVVDAQA